MFGALIEWQFPCQFLFYLSMAYEFESSIHIGLVLVIHDLKIVLSLNEKKKWKKKITKQNNIETFLIFKASNRFQT